MTVPGGQEQQDGVLPEKRIEVWLEAAHDPILTNDQLRMVIRSHETLRAEAETLRRALRERERLIGQMADELGRWSDWALKVDAEDGGTYSEATEVLLAKASAALAAADATQERNADAAAAGGGRQ